MHAACPRGLRSARDEFDAFAARADLRVCHVLQARENGHCPFSYVIVLIDAVVQVDAGVRFRDLEREAGESTGARPRNIKVRPCLRVIRLGGCPVHLNRDLVSLHVLPAVPLFQFLEFLWYVVHCTGIPSLLRVDLQVP